ncbi:phospholipase D family protein [Pseudomonas putida]|uniref:phospholipase D family protein n=1 Tax=Pseudomonas putida TaxID=303 RepID=UPI0009A1EE8D|nr:phospholipase D family protein [Pseudomonas putida]
MELISTANALQAHLKRLIEGHDSISFGVAWASATTDVYNALIKNKTKIRSGVVGIHFYQTDAQVLLDFAGFEHVKFVMQPDGVFHPKVFLFRSDNSWEAIIGSANLTAGALGKNTELSTLITHRDGLNIQEIQSLIEGYSQNARVVTEDDAKRYQAIRDARKPQLDKLMDLYGERAAGKAAIDSSVMTLDWESYLVLLKEDKQHGFNERLAFLDQIKVAFASAPTFQDLDGDTRRAIAGLPNKVMASAAWFGSMRGAGVYKNVVIERPEPLSRALEHIPEKGTVTKAQFNKFIAHYRSAFPDGRDGIGTATRLLSMKRPDQFLCVDSANRKLLARDVGLVRPDQLDYLRYWDEVIERIMDAPWWRSAAPPSGLALKAWNARAAMLDALFYQPRSK